MATPLRFLTTCLLGMSLLGAARAQNGLDSVEELPSTIRGELAPAHAQVLGVRLDLDSFSGVTRLLGPARAFRLDGVESPLALCYVPTDPAADVAVIFQSTGPEAGAVVSAVAVTSRRRIRQVLRNCSSSPEVPAAVATAGGIVRGMTREAFRALFPETPSEESPRNLGYYYFDPVGEEVAGSTSVGSRRSGCQLLTGVRARVEDRRVQSFTVYRRYEGRSC